MVQFIRAFLDSSIRHRVSAHGRRRSRFQMVFHKVLLITSAKSNEVQTRIIIIIIIIHAFFRDKKSLGSPVIQSFSNLIRFHLGSVAFGSFFIALIQMIRTILTFIEERCKNSESEFIKKIASAVECCLSCFESILKYFTRTAYIEIGENRLPVSLHVRINGLRKVFFFFFLLSQRFTALVFAREEKKHSG